MARLLMARRFDVARSVLAGALSAAVAQRRSGSALLDLAVLVPATTGTCGWHIAGRRWAKARAVLSNVLLTAAVASALVLPGWLARQQPEMRWYFVDSALASPLWSFVQAQAEPLLFVLADAVAAMVGAASATPRHTHAAIAIVAAALLALVGHGGIAVAVVCAALVLLTAPLRGEDAKVDRTPLVILAASAFAIRPPPEIVVGDMASCPVVERKRWQMPMRFWLEG
jgi:hypothetical protein